MFGQSLNERSLGLVRNLCAYLSSSRAATLEGIFRVSADDLEVDLWVTRLDADALRDLGSIGDPSVVAALLKRYLRLLWPPLLTLDLYEAFLAAQEPSEPSVCLSRLCACVMKLPPLNHDILLELLKMLAIVLECEDKNRMGVENLATVFTPCLLHRQTEAGTTDISRLFEEQRVIALLFRNASTVILLERVGAAPRDTGDVSSAFPGIRVLSNPSFSASPLLSRRSPAVSSAGTTAIVPPLMAIPGISPPASPPPTMTAQSALAYAKYDYKGSQSADTLTLTRGEAVTILDLPSPDARWCRCRLRDSLEVGYVPTSFLDCPLLASAPLGRERALGRAGTTSVPVDSPLRKPMDHMGESSSPLRLTSSSAHVPSTPGLNMDPLATLARGGVRSVEEIADRMDILSRALVREKEERMALEKRLQALIEASRNTKNV